MALWDAIRGQFIDVIEWVDESRDTLVHKFDRRGNEIKNGAQLIVRESQCAVFLHEGELGDVFGPGRVQLTTNNIPVLTSLKSWKYAFNSPFKCDVYFVNTRQFTDRKWGTQNPIMLRDPEFGPVRLRAFGTYAFRVKPGTDGAGRFIREMAGTTPLLTDADVDGQLRSIVISRFADALGEAKIPLLDLASQYVELGDRLRDAINSRDDFQGYGLELTRFYIENISLPEEVERALDKRAQMSVLGDMNKYTQFQAANALGDAANNPGGAGSMMGMMLGANMGGIVNQAAAAAQQAPAPAPAPAPASAQPPPLPGAVAWYVAKDGQQTGPYEAGALPGLMASRHLTPDSLVWRAGMAEWTRADAMPELRHLFSPMPPPLPNR